MTQGSYLGTESELKSNPANLTRTKMRSEPQYTNKWPSQYGKKTRIKKCNDKKGKEEYKCKEPDLIAGPVL